MNRSMFAVAVDGSSGRMFCGRQFDAEEVALICDVVSRFGALSRTELANTVCELLEWKRPNGRLKSWECLDFLEELEGEGLLHLPEKRARRPRGSRTRIPVTKRGEPGAVVSGSVEEFSPVMLEAVRLPAQRELFRELIGRYHSLGHTTPFGAHLRYLVSVSRPQPTVVGCVQFSSAAWRMAARDRWIGWEERTRRENLQHVVTQSRFLIVPWVRVKNLASTILSLSVRRMREDWREQYAVEPWLAETLVDSARYAGGCYRAANWIVVGTTSGRGRMDRGHLRHGAQPKSVWVCPLTSEARARLCRGGGDDAGAGNPQ
ncbi:MAG: DUF4338 domain-containing protein [Terriglobales bacterium]